MNHWFFHALLAAGLWGVWGLFGKMASRTLTAQGLFCSVTAGCIAALLICLALCLHGGGAVVKSPGSLYGFISGFVLIMGLLFFYRSLESAEATRMVVITATYPLVTVVLAYFFLGETVSMQKIIGAFLAVSGVIFLSL